MSALPKLGIVTIGQAPRIDLHVDLHTLLGNQFERVEMGALDGLDLAQIEQKYPIMGTDKVLVSRMQDGRQVRIEEHNLEPLLIKAVHKMQASNPEIIVVLCTGDLPEFTESNIPILSPKRIVKHFFLGLSSRHELAIMSPIKEQIANTEARWEAAGFHCEVTSGSPYLAQEDRDAGARKAATFSAPFLYLDCMGYSLEQAQRIAKISGKTTITPRQIIFNTVKTLLESHHS